MLPSYCEMLLRWKRTQLQIAKIPWRILNYAKGAFYYFVYGKAVKIQAAKITYCHVTPSQQCQQREAVLDVGFRDRNERTLFPLGSQGDPSPEGRLSVVTTPVSHVTTTSVPLLTTAWISPAGGFLSWPPPPTAIIPLSTQNIKLDVKDFYFCYRKEQ